MREKNPHHMTSQKQICDLEVEPQKVFHHLPTPVFSGALLLVPGSFLQHILGLISSLPWRMTTKYRNPESCEGEHSS